MQENKNVLEQILSQYLAEKNPIPAEEALLQEFAQYATKWLAEAGIVGVGHTDSGLALRLKDGQEIVFFKQEVAPPAVRTAAFSITGGNTTGVKNAYTPDSNSLQITGSAKK